MLERTRRFFKALRSGFAASATSCDIPDAGVRVEALETESQCTTELMLRYRKRSQVAEAKLEAATEALRRIECISFKNAEHYSRERIHEIAQIAWREIQK